MIPFSDDSELLKTMEDHNVGHRAKASSNWDTLLTYSTPWLFLIIFWIFMLSSDAGRPKENISIRQSKAVF